MQIYYTKYRIILKREIEESDLRNSLCVIKIRFIIVKVLTKCKVCLVEEIHKLKGMYTDVNFVTMWYTKTCQLVTQTWSNTFDRWNWSSRFKKHSKCHLRTNRHMFYIDNNRYSTGFNKKGFILQLWYFI